MWGTFREWARRRLRLLRAELRRPSWGPKVFCIGHTKTGTTTLGKSLELLGLRNASFDPGIWSAYRAGDIDRVLRYATRFESFDDLPWLKEDLIPLLDERFPGSKFIYLQREEAAWLKSFRDWTVQMTGESPDEEKGIRSFRAHRRFVLEYFADRSPENFIVLEVADPQGFRKLGEFLGRPAPQDHFPHFNKTKR